MPSINELRATLDEKHTTIRKLADEYNERKKAGKTGAELWPAETRAAYDKANKEYDDAKAEFAQEKDAEDVAKRAADLDKEFGERSNPNSGDKPGREDTGHRGERRGERQLSIEELERKQGMALQAFLRPNESRYQTDEYREASKFAGIESRSNESNLMMSGTLQYRSMRAHVRRMCPDNADAQEETRALSAYTGSAGGNLIAQRGFMGALEVNMLAVGSVEKLAGLINTDTGERIPWPTLDDTTNEGEMLGEFPEATTSQDPTISNIFFDSFSFGSGCVKIPNELIDDSPENVVAVVSELLGQRIGRAKNRKFTVGNGVGQPHGFVRKATVGKTTASATVITADEILQLLGSIDPVHRESPGFALMCHNNIITEIRLLKDAENRYIWKSGLADGRPDTIDGKPLAYNQHMDSALSASNDVLVAGDFSKYKIRNVKKVFVQRFLEKYTNAVGLLIIQRADGNLLDAGTAPLKKLRMHS